MDAYHCEAECSHLLEVADHAVPLVAPVELWVIGDGRKLPLAQAGGYYWWAERLVPPERRAGRR